jgi:hypothetical protein
MGWVFFQVFLAFGIGIAIVWWTWPKKKKEDARHGAAAGSNGRKDAK